MQDLTGRTALVTGASSGIGRAIARELARRGVRTIWLVARTAGPLERLAAEIGPAARVLTADLSTVRGRRAVLREVSHVDVLVNNAGVLLSGFFDDQATVDPKGLHRLVQTNCLAVLELTSGFVPGMVSRRRGWILNVGSVVGDLPSPQSVAYCASKAFINTFTEALRMELSTTGVHVHLLAPGPVRTSMLDTLGHAGIHVPRWLQVDASSCAMQGVAGLLAGRARTTPNPWVRGAMALASLAPLWLWRGVVSLGMPLMRRRLVTP
ncbi:MAG: SDR family NAD(P)-dependent oxidoreductase [Myxococcales bacterium]|nr:SDR family NAD(P)-dependent oxidoreductase [Myxococcales bacterium]